MRPVLAAWLLALYVGLAAASAQAAPVRVAGTVDLHAHLFMSEGLGWLFRGSFDGVVATSWADRLSSKADAVTLEASGNSVVVVSLFAHPAYVLDLRASIRRQVARARQFVRDHKGWVIARSAYDAKRQLARQKKVLVLSLEGAAGVLESREDLI